jgi:hypothetical protein
MYKERKLQLAELENYHNKTLLCQTIINHSFSKEMQRDSMEQI